MKVYTFCPEEKYSCGGLGEWPITYIAWIDDREEKPSVNIARATIEFSWGGMKQVLDVTRYLEQYPYSLAMRKEEILSSWRRSLTKQWDEVES